MTYEQACELIRRTDINATLAAAQRLTPADMRAMHDLANPEEAELATIRRALAAARRTPPKRMRQ